jgi:hypothetical protein
MDPARKHRLLRAALTGSRWLGQAVPPPVADATRREEVARQVFLIINDLPPEQYHAVLRQLAYMRRWRPRRTGPAAVLDQLLHAAYATVVLLPVLAWPSAGSAIVCGLVIGVLREIEQYFGVDLRILMPWDRAADVSAFAIAALLVYLLAAT